MDKKNVLKGAFYFLGVIILSLSITAMILTGGDLNGFYYKADSWKLSENFLNDYSCSGMSRLSGQDLMEITEEDAITVLLLQKSTEGLPYLFLDMQIPQDGELQIKFEYYDENGYLSEDPEEVRLKNGKQYILLSGIELNTTRIGIRLYNERGKQFWIESASLEEKIRNWSTTDFVFLTLAVSLAWLLFICCVKYLWKKRNKRKQFLTDFIIGSRKVMGKLAEKIEGPQMISSPRKSVMRMLLFAVMLFLMQYLDSGGKILWLSTAAARLMICSVMILFISVLSIETGNGCRRTNLPFLKLWVVQGLLCIVSEFIVEKRLCGRGVFMLLILGFLFYVWGGMKKPETLLLDFSRALELTFWVNTGYCILLQPVMPAERYVGFTNNPNIYMMYLLPELLAVLMGIYRSWRERHNVRLFLQSAGMGIGSFYLWKTECRTGLLGILLALAIIIISILWQRKTVHKLQWCMLLVSIISVFAGMLFVHAFGQTTEVYAIERFFEKLRYSENLNQFSSGRIRIYKSYIEQMNLWGHGAGASVEGTRLDAHNGILTMGYMYGILIIMPYLAWISMYMVYAVRYWRNKIEKSAFAIFPVLTVSAMLPVLLIENLELFLRWPVWILYYLSAGILFQKEKHETNEITKV